MDIGNKRRTSSLLADALTPVANKRPRPPSYIASPVGSHTHTASQPHLPSKKVCYFNDPVHGTIGMSDLCLEIIDTKEFQRLRDLKQLGTADYVYPGATHTRFSHSLGVAHFAEKTLRTLMRNQPELDITEVDVLCVKVAGLCHDLGNINIVFEFAHANKCRPYKYINGLFLIHIIVVDSHPLFLITPHQATVPSPTSLMVYS
ncbi:HD domain-containing protein [archaeon]|nr:MAG: HD domain-containing protein [archaeon]